MAPVGRDGNSGRLPPDSGSVHLAADKGGTRVWSWDVVSRIEEGIIRVRHSETYFNHIS